MSVSRKWETWHWSKSTNVTRGKPGSILYLNVHRLTLLNLMIIGCCLTQKKNMTKLLKLRNLREMDFVVVFFFKLILNSPLWWENNFVWGWKFALWNFFLIKFCQTVFRNRFRTSDFIRHTEIQWLNKETLRKHLLCTALSLLCKFQ